MSIDQNSRDSMEALFGALRKSPFVERVGDPLPQSRPAGDGNIQPVGYIADGAIDDIATFAASIRPPVVVDTLPSLPDSNYPQGAFVFLTTDEKLYRNTDGSTWSVAVDGADIVANSITAGQIAAGAIGADQLAANAVIAEKIAVGGIETGNLIFNGSFERTAAANPEDYTTSSSDLPGWTLLGSTQARFVTTGYSRTGSRGLQVAVSSGSPSFVGAYQIIPVVAGRTYRLRGWYARPVGTTGNAQLIAHTLDKNKASVAFNVISTSLTTSGVIAQREGQYTIPTDGSVSYLRIECRLTSSPSLDASAIFDDVVLGAVSDAVRNGPAEVVIDSTGIAITNGKITVSNPGSTVIIDGTSNMFKIAADGTMSRTQAANTQGSATVNLTGLPSRTTAPAYLTYVSDSVDSDTVRALQRYSYSVSPIYVADSSGGSPTRRGMVEYVLGEAFTFLSSSKPSIYLGHTNRSTVSLTMQAKYYVLQEAAF